MSEVAEASSGQIPPLLLIRNMQLLMSIKLRFYLISQSNELYFIMHDSAESTLSTCMKINSLLIGVYSESSHIFLTLTFTV
jgi:hypothetical protein